jgi:2-methylcitrate dehydratase PrpD
MSLIGELASFVTGTQASALPEVEQERLRLHLTDTVIAALAGTRIPEGKALRAFGGAETLAARIGRRAAAARLTEIDDIHLPSCVTPSAAIVPLALVLAAEARTFDSELIASAIWVGTELAVRIGLAVSGPQILYRGIWPSYLAAPVAAAATAARLFALNEARTVHALSLAFMLVAGGVGRIHGAPSGRWFLYANAIAGGIAAAEAARADYQGDPDLLQKTWLADTHGIALDPDRLLKGLGSGSVYASLSLKPFCSAKQAIAAIEAFRTILADTNLGTEAITRIRVRVPPAYSGMIATPAAPGARQSSLVSVAHQIALAASKPHQLYDVDRSCTVADEVVARFAGKVEVVADAALATFYPQHWPAEVEIEADGKVLQRRVVAAAGDPERPLRRADIDEKGHRVLDPLLGAARVDGWLAMCHGALHGRTECERLVTAFADAAG